MPGQYVRTARTARAARRARRSSARSKRRFGLLLTGIVVLLLFFVAIYPRVTAMMAGRSVVGRAGCGRTLVSSSDLDQSGISDVEWQQMPITVVP